MTPIRSATSPHSSPVPTVYPGAPSRPASTSRAPARWPSWRCSGTACGRASSAEPVAFWRWLDVRCRDIDELRALLTTPDLDRHVVRLHLDMTVTVAEESEVERILRDLQGTEATHGRAGVLLVDRTNLRLAARVRRRLPGRSAAGDCRTPSPASTARRRRGRRGRAGEGDAGAGASLQAAADARGRRWGGRDEAAPAARRRLRRDCRGRHRVRARAERPLRPERSRQVDAGRCDPPGAAAAAHLDAHRRLRAVDWRPASASSSSPSRPKRSGSGGSGRSFGEGGSALLQESKNGVDFDDVERARKVDGKLRELLRWGIPEPAARAAREGLPTSFLATVLLSTQSDVGGRPRRTACRTIRAAPARTDRGGAAGRGAGSAVRGAAAADAGPPRRGLHREGRQEDRPGAACSRPPPIG